MEEAVVWCYECDTPSHGQCFAYAGRCPVYGCTGLRYKEAPGKSPGVTWIEIKDEAGTAVPQAMIVDFTSSREAVAVLIAALAFLIAFLMFGFDNGKGAPFPSEPLGFWALVMIATFAGIYRLCITDYYVVDGKRRKVWLHMRTLGRAKLTEVAKFEQCRRLYFDCKTKSVKHGYSDEWRLILLVGEKPIELTDKECVRKVLRATRTSPPAELVFTAQRVGKILDLTVDSPIQDLLPERG
jgi:hypothetical protein